MNTHIHSFVNIAGPLLGAPKTLSSLISGDMKDTVQLGILESVLVESLLSRKERAYLFRRWPGLLNLIPKGDKLVWPNPTIFINNLSLSMDEVIDKLLLNSFLIPPETSNRTAFILDVKENPWLDPLHTPLPDAPNMTIYSFYGVGKETENGYYYKLNDELMNNSSFIEMIGQFDPEAKVDILKSILKGQANQKWILDDSILPLIVDSSYEDKEAKVVNGVITVDGDGTVPLCSLSLMGTYFWQNFSVRGLNPHSVKIVTREYLHEPVPMLFISGRGGPRTSDHVDILGNHEMTFDILRIVSGNIGTSSETHSNPISLVDGKMSNLAKDIRKTCIKRLNHSIGRSSGVLYEHDVCYKRTFDSNHFIYRKSDIFSKTKRKRFTLENQKYNQILELQYNSTVNKLISEAIELPQITNRYYSNIEEIAKNCYNKELNESLNAKSSF